MSDCKHPYIERLFSSTSDYIICTTCKDKFEFTEIYEFSHYRYSISSDHDVRYQYYYTPVFKNFGEFITIEK